QRESALGTVLSDRFAQQQQVLLARIEQSDNTLAAYIGQLEDRLLPRNAEANPVVQTHKLTPFSGNTTLR
ncbi:MAG: hypothetical protein JWR60_2179, partial [Polaromonas sp.]|nr:hypothetical protein [Polaromonas sp.]